MGFTQTATVLRKTLQPKNLGAYRWLHQAARTVQDVAQSLRRIAIGLAVILLAVGVLQYATIRRARRDAKLLLDTAAGEPGN